MDLKKIFPRLVLILFVIGLLALNPTAQEHRNAIKEYYQYHNPGILGRVFAEVYPRSVRYGDFLFFSITKDGDSLVSVGLMGKVFVVADLGAIVSEDR
ncbi:MAG: hypothetical protein KatS3mg029_0262 [Saprospiraceae bacterium]|nr:MAG: hypothetical protein KatS3mg029_0262 [Saprospiraceae bacterium]